MSGAACIIFSVSVHVNDMSMHCHVVCVSAQRLQLSSSSRLMSRASFHSLCHGDIRNYSTHYKVIILFFLLALECSHLIRRSMVSFKSSASTLRRTMHQPPL